MFVEIKRNCQKGKGMKKAFALLSASVLVQMPSLGFAGESGSENPAVRRAVQVCAACHGPGGNSTVAVYPKLAGQPRLYTIAQLKAFRDQKRYETDTQAYMWGISALLDDEVIAGLADYYEEQPPSPGKKGRAALVKRGQDIFDRGIPEKGIRACAACHGENAEGAAGFPRLAGQHAPYIVGQMRIFRTKLRPHGVIMNAESKPMTPAEIEAVAEYAQSR